MHIQIALLIMILTMFVVTKRRGRKKHTDFFHVGISEPEA